MLFISYQVETTSSYTFLYLGANTNIS